MKAKQLKMREGHGVQPLILMLGYLMAALWVNPAAAAGKAPYPIMARIGQYRMASEADEIAHARSAAPASISDHAEIMVLGRHGYDVGVKGSNGFVCLVERSWAHKFDSADFWNPKMRAPLCLNPAAMRSVESAYLKRTEWVLSGMSRVEMRKRTLAAVAAKEITAPEPGAMSYMMSKDQAFPVSGPVGHQVTNWYPHLMFYYPNTQLPKWGANLSGVPVFSNNAGPLYTILLVLVPKWSDGTPSPASK
ncbi:MAG: hypothetical protein ACRETA_10225 [Gammaproteobacteria bacterium]